MVEYQTTVSGKEVEIFLYHDLTENQEEELSRLAHEKYFNNKKEEKEND